MMENIYFSGIIISILFFILKILEYKFQNKDEFNLKKLIIDTIFVYLSVIIGYYILNQFEIQTNDLVEAPVFSDGPGF
tara:strand:+ start:267 stop:500 length:234 start_codon:yes stop_codon:yes gene_type:complete